MSIVDCAVTNIKPGLVRNGIEMMQLTSGHAQTHKLSKQFLVGQDSFSQLLFSPVQSYK